VRRKVCRAFGAVLSACAFIGVLLLAPGVAQAQTGKYLWVSQAGYSAATSTTSPIWGGWVDLADNGDKFYQSRVQFNVPDSDCPTPDAQAAVWVGLDGATDATVEQAGVAAVCANSKVSYYDWYDMAPNGRVKVNPVSPGDTIVAYANYNPRKKRYYMGIDDESDPAESFNSPAQACPSGSTCDNSSAEVVVEDPGGPAGGGYLADFHKANFSDAQMVSASGLVGALQSNSEWHTEKVTMQYKSYPMVQVGARSDGSTAFTDTWEGPG
jgi:hypothetical protein